MRQFISLASVALVIPSIRAQTAEQKQATVKFLQELQVADGGFVPAPVDGRLDQNPRGSLRATSGALRALKYFGGAPNDKKAAAQFVEKCWDAKAGCFGKDDTGASDLESSYRIMRCYHMLKKPPPRPDALREFIAKCRNADGGYGVQPGKPSQVSGTYYAGIILAWLTEQ